MLCLTKTGAVSSKRRRGAQKKAKGHTDFLKSTPTKDVAHQITGLCTKKWMLCTKQSMQNNKQWVIASKQ